jgi:hypothetical protein
LIQTSATNQVTRVGAIPSGSATSASFVALNDSSAANCETAVLRADASASVVASSKIGSGTFQPLDFQTSDTGRMRIGANGDIGVGTEVGGGATNAANSLFKVGGVYKVSSNIAYAYNTGGTFPSGTTSAARVYRSDVATEAASFTIPSLYHFEAVGTSLGAGSAVTTEVGFYGNLASGSGKWNFYAGGSAANLFAGTTVVGTDPLATNATAGFLYVPTCAGTPTGTPTTYGSTAPIVVDSTNNKLYFYSNGTWRDAGP